MGEDFKFSCLLRNDEKERFLEHEERVQKRLKNIVESSIVFKTTNNVILLEITTPSGEVFKDIYKKDDFIKNHGNKFINLALGVNENE